MNALRLLTGRHALVVLALLGSTLWTSNASASHFRHGIISWRIPDEINSPRTVEFTVTHSWRAAFTDGVTLRYGDGASAPYTQGTNIGGGVDVNGNAYTTFQFKVTHTYAADGLFNAFFESCCRVSGLINGASSDFRVEASVHVGDDNTSPSATAAPAILQMQAGGVRTHDFITFDPDLDTLGCRLGTFAEAGGVPTPSVPNGGASPTVALNGNVCQVTWDLTNAVGGQQYVLHTVFESSRAGSTSETELDLIVEIVSEPVPICPDSDVFNIQQGDPFNLQLGATDPGNMLTIGAIGVPSGSTLTPPAGTTQLSPIFTDFDWTPGPAFSATTTYSVVTFKNPQDITGSCTLVLNVPPVCGNNIHENNETCDNGPLNGMDGICSVNCLLENSLGCSSNEVCENTCVSMSCVDPAPPGGACDPGDDDDCAGGGSCDAGGVCGSDGSACVDNGDCINTCIGGICGPTVGVGNTCDASDSDDCTGALECDAAGVCGGNGAGCTANAECVNTCIGGVCSDTASVGGACDASDSNDCTGALACDAAGVCGGDGASCAANSDCVNTCIGLVCGPTVGVGATCDNNDDADCTGALGCDAAGVCGGDGEVCAANGDCVNTCIGLVCGPTVGVGATCDNNDDADCTGALGCDAAGVCGGDGEVCAANGDCVNTCIGLTCAAEAAVGGACDAGDSDDCSGSVVCDGAGVCGGDGVACAANGDCVNTCIGLVCGPTVGVGATCDNNDDADCTGALGCDAAGVCGGDGETCAANDDCVNTCIGLSCAPEAPVGGTCDASDSDDCSGSICDGAGVCGGDGVSCGDNDECVNTCIGSICEPTAGVGGTCDASDSDDCTGALGCDGAGVCGGDGVGCALNDDCVNTCIGLVCSPTADLGEVCDATDEEDCTGILDCNSGGVCGGNDAACGENDDCVNTCISNICDDPNAVSEVCDANDDEDCVDGVNCNASGECGGTSAVCDGNDRCTEICIGNVCQAPAESGGSCDLDDDDDCASAICVQTTCEVCEDDAVNPDADTGCGPGLPFCETSAGAGNFECVECQTTVDCGLNNFCDMSNTCAAGCENDGDCGGASPACDLSLGSPGTCELCTNDAAGNAEDNGCDAGGDGPLCALSPTEEPSSNAGGLSCRVCVDDGVGPTPDTGCGLFGAFCDSTGLGSCVNCVDDSNCVGFRVCTALAGCQLPDSDNDGLYDDIDIDDDGDGIPDADETGGTDYSGDADDDGIPDYADPGVVTCIDSDEDGVCDELPAVVDLDGDGIPNHLDLDSDADGLTDELEGQDADGDGTQDAFATGNDEDADGLDDAFDADCAGMPGGCLADGAAAMPVDSDGDGAPNYLDVDSDNDGLSDRNEAFDSDLDGRADAPESGVDVDGDGIDDAYDADQGGLAVARPDPDNDGLPADLDVDSDGDGIRDDAECPNPALCPDPDGDGVVSQFDLDSDNDGIVDAVEGHDADGNGEPDFLPLEMDADADGLDDAYDVDQPGGVPAPLPDFDADGTPDVHDVDDDGDGVGTALECTDPQDCEDSNNDGIPDYLDPETVGSDMDGDGIPDLVECAGDIGTCGDTDGDGTSDHLDPDDDGDGIPTAVECPGGPTVCNTDADGRPDHLDIDSDGDGITDAVECSDGASCDDSDGNGVPDYRDSDADGDGIPDSIEGHDANMDGIADRGPAGTDTDGDGLDDAFDEDDGGTAAPTQDTDSDGAPDFQDSDDDNDGIDTSFECTEAGNCPDSGGTIGVPDYLDNATSPADDDMDGIPNSVECPDGDTNTPETCRDSDNDGMPDFNDPDDDNDGIDTRDENYDGDSDPTDEDSDGDGKPDYLDDDDDGDMIPTATECQDFDAGCPDTDGDGAPDYLDICGDGTVSLLDITTVWEECDDGNEIDGDGCDASCRLEAPAADGDNDGIPDNEECPPPGSPFQPETCPDSDGDGMPDFNDEDDDNDGVNTRDEDIDRDGDPRNDDTDGDGIPNYLDEDDDGDGIDSIDELGLDTDEDGTPNYLDEDDDGDTIDTRTEREDAEMFGDDVDNDGLFNWLDTDSDGDGIPDSDEAGDANSNGVPDYLETEAVFGLSGGGFGCSVGLGDENRATLVWMVLIALAGAALRRKRA